MLWKILGLVGMIVGVGAMVGGSLAVVDASDAGSVAGILRGIVYFALGGALAWSGAVAR